MKEVLIHSSQAFVSQLTLEKGIEWVMETA